MNKFKRGKIQKNSLKNYFSSNTHPTYLDRLQEEAEIHGVSLETAVDQSDCAYTDNVLGEAESNGNGSCNAGKATRFCEHQQYF